MTEQRKTELEAELKKIEKDLIRIDTEIKYGMRKDIIDNSWMPMKQVRLNRKAEINDILVNETLFV